MKIIKKILIGLLNIILIDLIVLLIINLSLKSFIIKDIVIESVKSDNQLININNNGNVPENNTEEEPIITNNKVIQEILEDEEMQEYLSDFIDDLVENMSEEEMENISTEELQKKVTEYLKKHKEELSEKTGVEITDEMIDESNEMLSDVDVQKSIDQQISNYKNNLTKEEKIALKAFNFINSEKLRLIIIISILLDILIIALLQKSIYKWIKNLSYAMFISGLSIVILITSIKYFVSRITNVVINTESILTLGIITLVFGIIILIVYKIMTKHYIKENEYEVS